MTDGDQGISFIYKLNGRILLRHLVKLRIRKRPGSNKIFPLTRDLLGGPPHDRKPEGDNMIGKAENPFEFSNPVLQGIYPGPDRMKQWGVDYEKDQAQSLIMEEGYECPKSPVVEPM